ncbi:MAG: hypothetical protein MJE68_18820 [Proteobacteria bacterium]|nr:hypothetical protein [Pseudomonadota bacterium]
MALVLILTSESLVIRAQLHLLIMLREHLDNHLNSITEEGGRREEREGEREGG